jgi:hypothetical protein
MKERSRRVWDNVILIVMVLGVVGVIPWYYFSHTVNPTWIGMCYAPNPPLAPNEIAANFGRIDLRVVYFDCRSSWVIPGEGPPGWYVIPASAEDSDSLANEWLGESGLEFEQYDPEGNREFSVYRFETAGTGLPEPLSQVRLVWHGARFEEEAKQPARFSPPLDLDGPATFLGHKLNTDTIVPGDTLVVETSWRANQIVTETMPSVFMHLVDTSGNAWSIGDALDFSAIQWQEGDVFVQRHVLELAPDIPAGTYWLAGGLYDLVTGIRYPIHGAETDADTFLLGPVIADVSPTDSHPFRCPVCIGE